MGLFDKKTAEEKEAEEYDRMSKDDLEGRLDMQDRQMIEESRRQVEDLVGMNLQLVSPSKINKTNADGTYTPSKFHAMLTQDLKISNISEADKLPFGIYGSLVSQFIDMGLEESALVLHAEREDKLALNSSVNGFERKMLVTAINQLQKSNQTPQQKKIL